MGSRVGMFPHILAFMKRGNRIGGYCTPVKDCYKGNIASLGFRV